jgi:hypothetical protein
MEKILKTQHGLADCGEAYSPILSGSDILKKYNEIYGPIDDVSLRVGVLVFMETLGSGNFN